MTTELHRYLSDLKKQQPYPDDANMAASLGDAALAAMLGVEEALVPSLLAAKSDDDLPARVRNQIKRLPKKLPFARPAPRERQKPDFTYIDLFAGIGGLRLPFHLRGGTCVMTSERDKHAKTTYAANFGEAPAGSGDITKITQIPDHDVLLAGFPCQAFSQAGKKEGFYDTRGTMFFEIQRFLAARKPKAFLLENVKQLRGHNGGSTLKTIMDVLRGEASTRIPEGIPMSEEARASLNTKLDYVVDTRVLRARDFGVPQNRERIYIVGIHKDMLRPGAGSAVISAMFDRVEKKAFTGKPFGRLLENNPAITDTHAISQRLWDGHQRRKAQHKVNGNGFGYSLFDSNSRYCNTISARYYKDGSEILVSRGEGDLPRKLTPREAARIQGFPEEFHIDAVGKSQMYKQFGNSVAVPVVDAIASELLPLIGVKTHAEIAEWLKEDG